MYAPFFGLNQEPFSIAPDPRFLYLSEQHREALAHLLYGLGGGGGFVLLTGEIGAGKTTVCRWFLDQVPEHCTVAYVFNPKLTVLELLQTVCGEFGIELPAAATSVKAHVDALNSFLLAGHALGRQAVLVIDEAQSLSADVLEQLRLLTNLETSERKLLQIVLIGQPELRDMLARPDLEQLAQRVIARYHLGPLSFGQTQQYVRHRLAVAGPLAPLPFTPAALARIHELSGGVPRRINLLADRALLGAYARGQARSERDTVNQAAHEVFGTPVLARLPTSALVWAGAAALSCGLAWLVWPASGPALVPPAASASAAEVAAAVPAPGLAPAAAASGPGPDTAAAGRLLWAAALPDAAIAWRELALRWNVAIGEGEPCAAAAQAQLACFRSTSGGLAAVRHLQRPAVLTLRGATGAPRFVLLVGLDDTQATLQAGSTRQTLTLPALANLWRGEFATFWRTPPGWRDGGDPSASPAFSAWMDAQLSAAGHAPGPTLAQRVWAFQLASGLPADGRAGPMTLMRLSRRSGVAEPTLPAS
jgi:general secretion pathway protein A